jgi:hypothetical protein
MTRKNAYLPRKALDQRRALLEAISAGNILFALR